MSRSASFRMPSTPWSWDDVLRGGRAQGRWALCNGIMEPLSLGCSRRQAAAGESVVARNTRAKGAAGGDEGGDGGGAGAVPVPYIAASSDGAVGTYRVAVA